MIRSIDNAFSSLSLPALQLLQHQYCPTLQWVQRILEVALPIFWILKYFLRYFDSNIQLIKLKTHSKGFFYQKTNLAKKAIEEHFGELMESFF